MKPPETAIKAYVAALEAMSPDTIDAALAHYSEGARFTDPFNDVTGKPALRTLYEDMFEKVSDLSFSVHAYHGADRSWLLRWTYDAHLGRLGRMTIDGMSHVELDAGGLVCRHADYWDAGALYERLPVLGPVLRLIRRRIAAPIQSADVGNR